MFAEMKPKIGTETQVFMRLDDGALFEHYRVVGYQGGMMKVVKFLEGKRKGFVRGVPFIYHDCNEEYLLMCREVKLERGITAYFWENREKTVSIMVNLKAKKTF